MCRVAVAAEGGPHGGIIPMSNIRVDCLFELFVNFRVAISAGRRNIPAVYLGSGIIDGQDFMVPVAILTRCSNSRTPELSDVLSVDAVKVGSHQEFSVFHSLDLTGMRPMARGTDHYLIQGIHLGLRDYFVGAVAIPAVRRRRFRSLQHLGMPASGYIFRFFLVAGYALRAGQESGVRKNLCA